MRSRKPKVDENWLDAIADDLRDQGCDEEFIECVLNELRDGNSITVETTNPDRATITRKY